MLRPQGGGGVPLPGRRVQVVGMLHKSSEVLEWGPVLEGYSDAERYLDAERYPGTGAYDTGAA